MKVSFDGMRRNLTSEMNQLHYILNAILSSLAYQEIDEDLKEELIEKFNDVASSADMFNCIHSNDVADDMNDLSDSISINRLEEL